MCIWSLFLLVLLSVAVQTQDATNTLELQVSSQTATVVAEEQWELTLYLKRTSSVEITLVPTYEPPYLENVVYSLPNVTVEPGATDWAKTVLVKGRRVGQVGIIWTAVVTDLESHETDINTSAAFTILSVIHSWYVDTVGYVIGWSYFVLWSLAYWPQVYKNWKRKSVIGLNFDYVALNALGNVVYLCFNSSLYWSSFIQAQYKALHPYGVLQVKFNDVFYALHASILRIVTGIQCCIYERGKQRMSTPGIGFAISLVLILISSVICVGAGGLTWLSVLYICSYVKLASTLVKNCPQVYMNYKRQSTEGWSISGTIMDIVGGICSILQMFLLAYNSDDWNSIFGNPTKFLLGLVSIAFDAIFMFQHYVLYRHPKNAKNVPRNSPTIVKENEDCQTAYFT